jgi:DNA polymerase-4
LYIEPGNEQAFLAPLSVNKFSGVGEQTFIKLKELGIYTIGDILKFPEALLEKKLGKWGVDLYLKAQGKYEGKVQPYHEAKSISTENTFHENIGDTAILLSHLVRMTEKVAYELRQDGKLAGCVSVKIRYPNFDTSSKQMVVEATFSDEDLIAAAIKLFHILYKKNAPVRLLGVRLSDLTDNTFQGNLFENPEKKLNLYKAIDTVKNKYGKDSLQKARTVPLNRKKVDE